MPSIRAGVAGVGAIGINHARIYSELPDVELAAVFDNDPARAAEAADRFGCKAAASLEEFATLVDAASVSVPTAHHVEVGTYLLGLGKHVLVEKPIAPSVEGAKALVEAARDAGCVLQVGHIERFNPVMAPLEAQLTSAKFIEAHRLSPFPKRSMDIGVVLDVMIHDLEIILHLVRSPIASVDAVGVPVLTHREDIANARIRFENGCVANVTASRISPEKMRKLRVFQGDSYLSLDYGEQAGFLYRKDGLEIKRDEVEVAKDEPLKLELAAFLECAAAGVQPKVSGHDGLAALELALEITRQITESNA